MIENTAITRHSKSDFKSLAELAQKIAFTRADNAKIKLCANYFRELEREDVRRAVQFLGEGAYSNISGKRASIGHKTVAVLAAEFCEIDYDLVFRPSKNATGSTSETIQRLLENIPEARAKWSAENLSLEETEAIFEKLYHSKSRAAKQTVLLENWTKMTPLEVKFFIRMLGQGSLKIGLESTSVVEAIAHAFNKNSELVRFAYLITGSIGETAVLAKSDRLEDAQFKLFHPLSFMLADSIESKTLQHVEEFIAEEKFNGIRCQVHISGNNIEFFTRDLNNTTSGFPEILEFFKTRNLPDVVLDGEICVFKNDTILPVQLLQERMSVKKLTAKMLADFPVVFVSFDIIYHDGQSLFGDSLIERRKKLEKLAKQYHLPISSQKEINSNADVEQLFKQALAHGNEGLVLKRKDSVYEYGQRRKSWLKVKKPSVSLDAVILYAHADTGKRNGTYSDFTLGISVKDDDRYEEEFIPIGKTNCAFSDNKVAELNKRIKELVIDRFGPTLLLKPDLIVELEFDDIRINQRTKAKYTLHLPRFKTIRWDLSPSDVDTLKYVERMFDEKLAQKRERQGDNPSFVMY